MRRTDINEVKRFFKINNCNIRLIHGTYVNGEKEIVAEWQQHFDEMEEVEQFKYLDIFKKCLSGNVGKTLYDIAPNSKVRDSLMLIANAMNAEDITVFVEKIINTYDHVGNYIILTINGCYDIPGKTSDGADMEDASDEVYEYTIMCICPVALSKPGLGYDKDECKFTNIERDWMIQTPEVAILYPAFNDRSSDRDAALAYIKSVNQDKKVEYENIFGCALGEIHKNQVSGIRIVIDRVLGPYKTINDVRLVEDKLKELEEQKKANFEEPVMTEEEFEKVLLAAGIESEAVSKCADIYKEELGAEPIRLNNVLSTRSKIITARGSLSLDNVYTQYTRIATVDGKKCLVLELDDSAIDMNGIEIKVRGD